MPNLLRVIIEAPCTMILYLVMQGYGYLMPRRTYTPPRYLVVLGMSLAGLLLIFLTSAMANRIEPLPQQATETPAMQRQFGEGLILPEMPADATQADYGKEAYRLVCSACHAYDGSGLTAEWISTWDPADQNCWQSKCHSLNHPPDGFELPRYVPAIMGPNELDAYTTAQDLHDYIKSAMPWQAPGYLTDEEYWNITAYLIQANGFKLPAEPLEAVTAANFVIDPSRQFQETAEIASSPPAPVEQAGPENGRLVIIGVALAVLAVAAGVYAFLIGRQKKT